MREISRRALLVSGAAAAATSLSGAAVLWRYRPYVWEKFRATGFALPPSELPECPSGPLAAETLRAMRGFFEELAGVLEFPALATSEFDFVVGLKCGIAPSYRKVYEDFVASLERASASLAPDVFVASLADSATSGGAREAQSLRFVVHEFLALQFARGGFRSLGMTNARGHAGGPGDAGGYRLSERESGSSSL